MKKPIDSEITNTIKATPFREESKLEGLASAAIMAGIGVLCFYLVLLFV